MKKKCLFIFVMGIFNTTQLYAQSGNVGIGTESPTNKLTINGNTSIGTGYIGTAAPSNGAIIEGSLGIGTNTPLNTLHVRKPIVGTSPNIVALFDPAGEGNDATQEVSIGLNGGRALFGYAFTPRKNIYIRGNQATDIRLQAVDALNNIYPDAFVMSSSGVSSGFIGLNTDTPQARLDVRGNIKSIAGTGVQTGNLWAGTSNLNGFEIFTTTAGDAWVGIQRGGTGAPLHVVKSAGPSSGQLINFAIDGAGIGSISYTATEVLYNQTSDMRLKENIHPSNFGLKTLKKIDIYDYNYKKDQKKGLTTGVLAQELYKVYPQAVTPGGADEKTEPWQVDYSKLVPILIKSVQEMSLENKKMAKEIKQLKKILYKKK